MSRRVLIALAFLPALLAAAPAAAGAASYDQRAAAVRDAYAHAWWTPPPADNTENRLTEWKKGALYAAEASFAAGAVAEGVRRARLALDLFTFKNDMFFNAGLIDAYARFPQHFSTNPADTSRVPVLQAAQALWYTCWRDVNVKPNFTQNQRVMLNVQRVLMAEDPRLATEPAGQPAFPANSACAQGNPLGAEEGVAWLRSAMREASISSLYESDSATYIPYYLAALRLLADTYRPSNPANQDLPRMAGMTFDAIVAGMAGEWLNGDHTATSPRQYFALDGSTARPVQLGIMLWVLLGGTKTPPTELMWDGAGGNRKPTGAPTVPLAISGYETPPEIAAMGTERPGPFSSLERSTFIGLTTDATRYTEPGALQLATASQPATAPVWWSSPGQDLSFRWVTPATGGLNRSLTIAAPDTDAWKENGLIAAQKQLQWLQRRRAAVGVLKDGALGKLRGLVPQDALGGAWASTRTTATDDGWHVFGVDNAWVGVRTATAMTPVATGALFANLLFESQGARNIVVLDSAPKSEYGRAEFVAALNSPSRGFLCSGVPSPVCTYAWSGVGIKYTTLQGEQLHLSWPAGAAAPTRWVNNVLVDPNSWPQLSNPWAQQAQGSDMLRVSGGGSTRVYAFTGPWATRTATPVANGGFEAGTSTQVSGFVNATWSGAPVYARVASPTHAGTGAGQIRLDSIGNGGFSINANARPAVVAGERTTVTAWIRTTGVVPRDAAGGAYVWAQYADNAGKLLCSGSASPSLTGTDAVWQSRSVALPRASSCPGATRVALSVRLVGTGTMWVDDIDVVTHP